MPRSRSRPSSSLDRERASACARALEDAAADLEERVDLRTTQLSSVNERLAESQTSHLGSWDWDVATGVVTGPSRCIGSMASRPTRQ